MPDEQLRTFQMRLCAPIPLGHDVVVHLAEKDVGVFATKFEVDADQPIVVDRTTGVVYGASWHPHEIFGWSKPIEPYAPKSLVGERVEGVVRACAVLLDTTSSHGHELRTVLTISVGAEGYR